MQDRVNPSVNDSGTGQKSGTPVTQQRSGPVRFEVVAYNGAIYGPYRSADEAVRAAKARWPHQAQDEDRTGQGWDLQVVGS